MRRLFLVLGVLCSAGCTGPDFIPIQGVVPAMVNSGDTGVIANDTGVIARVPVDTVPASPAGTSAMKL
jgi:hypothetical protein